MASADELGLMLIGRIDDGSPAEICSPATVALVRDLLVAAVTDGAGRLVELDDVAERHFGLAGQLSEFLSRLFAAAGDAARAAAQDQRARRLSVVGDASRSRADRELALAEVLLADDPAEPAAAEAALALHRRALGRRPRAAQSAASLMRFGIAYRERGTRHQSPDDLGRAVDLTRQALADPVLPRHHRADLLSMLALALTARFELAGDPEDLTGALTAARESAYAYAEPGRHLRLSNLGLVVNLHLQQGGDGSVLAELVSVAESAVTTADGQHERGTAWALQSIALSRRAEATGSLADLTRAVTVAKEATAALEGCPEHPGQLFNLAKVCFDRYRVIRSLEDLDTAVAQARAAKAAMESADPRRGDLLSVLTGALGSRFHHRGTIDDLLEAVDVCEEAVLGSPPSSARHLAMLSNLGNVRRQLAEWTRQLPDVDEAIRVAARAVAMDVVQEPSRRLNLAACYAVRFHLGGSLADLDHAVELLRQALAEIPAGSPARATYLSELSQRLVERHAAAPAASNGLTEAFEMFRQATELTTAPSLERLRAAGRWADAAARHGLLPAAAEGNATAVRLLSVVAWHGLDRCSQEAQLRTWSPLVLTSAAQALTLSRSAEAVELLEHGRNVLWGHQLGRQADLHDLRARHADLADRLDAVRRALT